MSSRESELFENRISKVYLGAEFATHPTEFHQVVQVG
jgi:hypothetical protein